MNNVVQAIAVESYDAQLLAEMLPKELFSVIRPTDRVVLKPNWVRESHLRKPGEWEYVITHPAVITAVMIRVCEMLSPGGTIIIADAPQTDSSFVKILSRYPVSQWYQIAEKKAIKLEIIDLREDEWIQQGDVVVNRRKLEGDPRGSTEVNLLDEASEFFNHRRPARGYYGADYNIRETNEAHDGHNNRYRLSRTIIEADVFINIPKLKTHKKAGITCCLKNLVGINTYKNFLPHHAEGGPGEGGDQFPTNNMKSRLEGSLLAWVKQNLLRKPIFAQMMKPFGNLSRMVFGKTEEVIRSGNWYGNDTLWRMTLDLNKACLFANPDGSMRPGSAVFAKKYIGIVDAIIAGEGNGPLAPDPRKMGYILAGTNPVAIDCVCAGMMGFDPMKIPTLKNAFKINQYPICNFDYSEIMVMHNGNLIHLAGLPGKMVQHFEPHFAWKSHIEKQLDS